MADTVKWLPYKLLPAGPFWWNGRLCFKSRYEGESYFMDTGEYFYADGCCPSERDNVYCAVLPYSELFNAMQGPAEASGLTES